jgi:hypothetical protein
MSERSELMPRATAREPGGDGARPKGAGAQPPGIMTVRPRMLVRRGLYGGRGDPELESS